MSFKKISLTVTLIVTLLSSLVSGLLVWWVNEELNRPRIEWDSRPHYKIDDFAIGNIFLINTGRKTDRNIALTLDINLQPKDIKIIDLTSEYAVKNIDNKTTIVIKELKPGESADITYRDVANRDDIEITSFVSDYSNIHFMFENKWWHFSEPIAILASLFLIFLGFIFGAITIHRFILRRKS